MAALVALRLHVLLLGDENHRDLLDAVGIGAAIVLAEVGRLAQIVEDGLDGGWVRQEYLGRRWTSRPAGTARTGFHKGCRRLCSLSRFP